MILGVPTQEKGTRPARALPYELDARATVRASNGTVGLTFVNTGSAAAVFQVRSGNPADTVRNYTVGSSKFLGDSWNIAASSYSLSVYGPNGFVRYFNGSVGSSAAVLGVSSSYATEGKGSIALTITNLTGASAAVNILDAYTGNVVTKLIPAHGIFENTWSLEQFPGWYDLIVTVAGDPTFKYELAGHVETGQDSISDPALGGLTLKS